MLPILSTTQYDQWKAIFIRGVRDLEEHLNDLSSTSEVFILSTALLGIAKELSAFLCAVASLPPTPAHRSRQRGRQPANAWLNIAIASLRVACHRYSWAVLQISIAMEKRAATARHQQEMTVIGDDEVARHIEPSTANYDGLSLLHGTGEMQGPATSSSMCSNYRSWWGGSRVTSPSGSMTPPSSCSEC